jgi:hypothetical protein
VDQYRRVKAETRRDCGKESGDAEIEPVDSDEPADRARNHAHRVGVHGRDAAADALADVEKSEAEAEPEADVGRADDAQVEGAEARDLGVVAEQSDPQAKLERDDQADRSSHHRDRRRAGPRDLAGTAILLRAQICRFCRQLMNEQKPAVSENPGCSDIHGV